MRRLVQLAGTAQLNVLVGNVSDYESYIFSALAAQGFDVVAVRITKQTLFTNQINVAIEINVDTQYTAEDARISAVSVINSIPNASYAYWGSPLFTNVNLSVLSDSLAKVIQSDPTQTDALQNILNNIGNTALKLPLEATKNLTSNSTFPLAIAAVVLGVLIMAMPKR